MTHIMIEDSSPEAKKLLAYVRTLPYVTVIDAKKKGFAEEAPVAARPYQRSQERDDRAEKTGGQAY